MIFENARRLLTAITLCLLGFSGNILAQSTTTYPNKSIHMVVPFASGSVTDILARIVSQRLGEALGQSVIVDNKPGADGNIGAAFVAAAQADGYTLLMGAASTNAINPSLHKNLRFDPLRDFAPITNVATVPNVLVVGPQVPARNVKEFIEAARNQKLTFASSGAGGSMHLSGELFKSSTRTPNLLHVPYKGGSAPVMDVMGERVSAMFCNLPLCLQHIRSGKLTALGVTSPKRSPLLPDIPTIAEAGVPGFAVEGWFGLFAPAAVPKPIIQRINAEVVKILQDPKVKEQLLTQGAEPAGSAPEQFEAFVKLEHDRWAKIIAEAGITLP